MRSVAQEFEPVELVTEELHLVRLRVGVQAARPRLADVMQQGGPLEHQPRRLVFHRVGEALPDRFEEAFQAGDVGRGGIGRGGGDRQQGDSLLGQSTGDPVVEPGGVEEAGEGVVEQGLDVGEHQQRVLEDVEVMSLALEHAPGRGQGLQGAAAVVAVEEIDDPPGAPGGRSHSAESRYMGSSVVRLRSNGVRSSSRFRISSSTQARLTRTR